MGGCDTPPPEKGMPFHARGAKITSERWTRLPIMSGQQRPPTGETGGLRSYVLRFVPWEKLYHQEVLKEPPGESGINTSTNVARS